jgi:hypothetical protein
MRTRTSGPAELAGRETAIGIRYACPCCDFLTLDRPPTGTYAIRLVCKWEDDNIQFEDPEREGGANGVCLALAREGFQRWGFAEHGGRPPLTDEHP